MYQLFPLDIFVYQYSLKEIMFTIKTSGVPFFANLIYIGLTNLVFLLIYLIISRKNHFNRSANKFFYAFLVFIPLYFIFIFFRTDEGDKFQLNKSHSFYKNSLSQFFNKEESLVYSEKIGREFQNAFIKKSTQIKGFPLIHEIDANDGFKTYFNKFDKKPNIVILICEGLSEEYVNEYQGVNLMPFMTELIAKSLYWEKCFTLGERSFAAVPSLLGSLPYAEIGFTLQEKYPRHLSLVSVLKSNNYQTRFFYGQGAWFHNKFNFFKYSNCDSIIDNSCFDTKYQKIVVGKEKFFWGYNDKDLFNNSFQSIDKTKDNFSIYFTGTMHAPFVINENTRYEKKFQELIKETAPQAKNQFNIYKKYFKTILFTDDALKAYFEEYSKRSDFENTIFIITGDHPMTEIPRKNLLKRFHVPLYVYSPKLKQAKRFTNVVSHLDLYESLLPFLKSYGVSVPKYSSALGSNLFDDKSIRKIPFMNDNREIIDFYSDGFYISGKDLYRVDKQFNILKIEDENRLKKMNRELKLFKSVNQYVCKHDQIYPLNYYMDYFKIMAYQKKNSNLKFYSNKEYIDITPKTKVKKAALTLEIEFDYYADYPEKLVLVTEIRDKKDSLLLYHSNYMEKDKKNFQQKIKLDEIKVKDSEYFIKVFLWNSAKQTIDFKHLKYLLY